MTTMTKTRMKTKIKTKTKITCQTSSVLYRGEDVLFIVPSSLPPPPYLLPRSRLEVSGVLKSVMKMVGVLTPPPPPPHIDFLRGGRQTISLLSSLSPFP